MKAPFLAKVLAFNVVLLLLAYLVYQDVAARAAYAGAVGFDPSTSYSILFHSLTLSGRGTVLTSPPTLDWFQLLALIAVATDAYMFWGYIKRSRIPEQPRLTAAEATSPTAQSLLEGCLIPVEWRRAKPAGFASSNPTRVLARGRVGLKVHGVESWTAFCSIFHLFSA